MMEKAFYFDYFQQEWMEIQQPLLGSQDMEELSGQVVLRVKWSGGQQQDYIWWKSMAQLMEFTAVGEVSDGSMLLSGQVDIQDGQERGCFTIYIPYRWRVIQTQPAAPVQVSLDLMQVQFHAGQLLQPHWGHWNLSLDFARRRWVSFPYDFQKENPDAGDRGVISKSPAADIGMPGLVSDIAAACLQDSASLYLGLRPGVICEKKGKRMLEAFLERPYDLNIIFLRPFIGEGFEQLFPKACYDNYRILCAYLGLKPPKSLRKAYALNPYNIISYMMMRQLGFQDVNVLRWFQDRERLFGIALDSLVYDAGKKQVVQRTWERESLSLLRYVFSWWINERGETQAARRLLKAMDHGWKTLQWDVLRMISGNFLQADPAILSPQVIQKFFREGPSAAVHDAMIQEINADKEQRCREYNIPLQYTAKEKDYEAVIDGCEFYLPKAVAELSKIGRKFHNCVISYADRVARHKCIIMVMQKNKQPCVCLELQEGRVCQALGPCNEQPPLDHRAIVCRWAQSKGIKLLTGRIGW